jgi:hypothetical protein
MKNKIGIILVLYIVITSIIIFTNIKIIGNTYFLILYLLASLSLLFIFYFFKRKK